MDGTVLINLSFISDFKAINNIRRIEMASYDHCTKYTHIVSSANAGGLEIYIPTKVLQKKKIHFIFSLNSEKIIY